VGHGAWRDARKREREVERSHAVPAAGGRCGLVFGEPSRSGQGRSRPVGCFFVGEFGETVAWCVRRAVEGGDAQWWESSGGGAAEEDGGSVSGAADSGEAE